MPSYQEQRKMPKGSLTLSLNKAEFQRLLSVLDRAGDLDTSPAVQKGLREGANLMKEAGKANLASRNKTQTGNLKRSFKIKVTRRKKIGNNYALSGFKRGKNAGNHAHLVDRGAVNRYTKNAYTDKLGRRYPPHIYRGSVRGTHFWTDAVNTEGRRALNNLTNIIEQELNKLMK